MQPLELDNFTITNINGQGMVVAAASQQDGTPSLNVTATDFTVNNTDAQLLSFIEVYENSILNIHHSHFTHVFT